MLPSLSPVDSTMVSPAPSAVPRGPVDDARLEFTRRQSDAAYAVDKSFFSGTSFEFGSALYRYRSAYASFLASINKCQYVGFAGPRLASVWPGAHAGKQASRMFSDSLVAQACEGGG